MSATHFDRQTDPNVTICAKVADASFLRAWSRVADRGEPDIWDADHVTLEDCRARGDEYAAYYSVRLAARLGLHPIEAYGTFPIELYLAAHALVRSA